MKNFSPLLFSVLTNLINDILEGNISKINHIKVIHDSYKNLKVLEKHKLSFKRPNNLYFSDPTITTIEFSVGCVQFAKSLWACTLGVERFFSWVQVRGAILHCTFLDTLHHRTVFVSQYIVGAAQAICDTSPNYTDLSLHLVLLTEQHDPCATS